MGLLQTRWEAKYNGHDVAVDRSELTKGFTLSWDGAVIGHRTWSWIGLGELHASAELDGRPVEVRVALEWGGLSQLDGRCTISVDGETISAVKVR